MKPSIRSYLRKELEKLRIHAEDGRGPFSTQEIDVELERRDEIERKRDDKLHYPELSHS